MGREEPAVSMDASGKLIWAKHNEILSSVLRGGGKLIAALAFGTVLTGADASITDNSPIHLQTKDLGSCEIYPSTLLHSPNGRLCPLRKTITSPPPKFVVSSRHHIFLRAFRR